MITADVLNTMLVARAEEVARHLYPEGKKKGRDWCVGSLDGGEGQSMRICLSGRKAGYCADFAGDYRTKTFLGLWADRLCNGNFAEAVEDVRDYLGVKDPGGNLQTRQLKNYKVPSTEKMLRQLSKSNRLVEYYAARGISDTTLKAFYIDQTKDGQAMVYPFLEREEDGSLKLVRLKYENFDRDHKGKKVIRCESDGKPCLFGKHAIPDSASYVIITEGEKDAMSWHQMGHYAVSIPQGASKSDSLDSKAFEWIELDWEWLSRFEKVYISFDGDHAGIPYAKEVIKRLGYERCYWVHLDHKDANEYLMDADAEKTPDFYLESAEEIRPNKIEGFFDDESKLREEIERQEKGNIGIPFVLQGIPFRFRPKEYTVLSGYNGHGKTNLLNELALHVTQHDWRPMVVSLEMPTEITKRLMLEMVFREKPVKWDRVLKLKNCPMADMVFYNHVGRVDFKDIVDSYRFAVKKYGTKLLIIDSLMRCGVEKDLQKQSEFISDLKALADETGTHILLVAHSRKPDSRSREGEARIPTKYDISGDADITNLADNIIIVWRNVNKPKKIVEAQDRGDVNKVIEIQNECDGLVSLDKQRHGFGEDQGKLGLTKVYFDSSSGQLTERKGERIAFFVDYLK